MLVDVTRVCGRLLCPRGESDHIRFVGELPLQVIHFWESPTFDYQTRSQAYKFQRLQKR